MKTDKGEGWGNNYGGGECEGDEDGDPGGAGEEGDGDVDDSDGSIRGPLEAPARARDHSSRKNFDLDEKTEGHHRKLLRGHKSLQGTNIKASTKTNASFKTLTPTPSVTLPPLVATSPSQTAIKATPSPPSSLADGTPKKKTPSNVGIRWWKWPRGPYHLQCSLPSMAHNMRIKLLHPLGGSNTVFTRCRGA